MKSCGHEVHIVVTDNNIKSFDRVARKYGVDYSLKKAEKEGKTEYLVFFKAKDVDVMTAAFKEYTGVSLKKEQRQSIRKKLEQAKATMFLRTSGRSLRIPMKPLSTSRPLIWCRKSAAMYGVIQTAGAKQLPSQAYSIVPIVAARCMSTAPTMASGFLNIPVPIIPKFRVGHYALHNTVSMRVLF